MASLNSVLDDVYQNVIPLDRNTTTKAKEIVKSVTEKLLGEMKSVDPLFSALFQRIYYSGSFYDGLRVGEPTEFDLNIVFGLRFLGGNLQWRKTVPGYAVLCGEKSFDQMFSPNNSRYNEYKKFGTFLKATEGGYLVVPALLLNWFESVIAKCFDRFYGSGYVTGSSTKIERARKCGPAHTIKIERCGLSIDVDLVPVFVFDCPINGSTTLVPKPPPRNRDLWRLSYPLKERAILDNQSAAKKLIKLLKRFRDMQDAPWKQLSSYYIKTLVMLELQPHWHEGNLGALFVDILRSLEKYLGNKKIPFYFDRMCNLLENVEDVTIRNMECRLRRINRDIESNSPETLRKYFI